MLRSPFSGFFLLKMFPCCLIDESWLEFWVVKSCHNLIYLSILNTYSFITLEAMTSQPDYLVSQWLSREGYRNLRLGIHLQCSCKCLFTTNVFWILRIFSLQILNGFIFPQQSVWAAQVAPFLFIIFSDFTLGYFKTWPVSNIFWQPIILYRYRGNPIVDDPKMEIMLKPLVSNQKERSVDDSKAKGRAIYCKQ